MRPFCIATIGTILGIIIGLYLKSIAFFLLIILLCISLIFIFKKHKKYIIIFFISFILFYAYITFLENNYNQITKEYNNQELQIHAIIISSPQEKEYKNTYQIQVIEIENKSTRKIKKEHFKLLCNIKKSKQNITLDYGDEITFSANFEQPSVARNDGGFDYSQYLKTKQIAGIVTTNQEEVKVISKNKRNIFETTIYNLKKYLIEQINKTLPSNEAGLCIGLILGDKNEISEDIQQDFKNSNLSHILAISGAHVSYILLAITTLIDYLKLHKRYSKLFIIAFLIFFMALVGFTPSVTRACIMVILNLMAKVLFRKPDIHSNLAISSFIILLFNPYALLDIGFQLSFGGTIGIILFAKNLFKSEENIIKLKSLENKLTPKQFNKDKIKSYFIKIKDYIKQMAIVTISANIIIIPIMMYHFNVISFTFLISNLLASPILGVCLISSMIFILTILIVNPLAKILSYFIQPILKLLIFIANISSKLPFSQILVPTPKIWQIILYYILLIVIFVKKTIIKTYSNSLINKKQIILKLKIKKVLILTIVFVLLFPYIFSIFPINRLEIHFIDVWQGDCTLIITKSNKKVLIDGGGSEVGDFDVGEKTLLPYLLDKGIMKIDYMMFTHFDADHCEGLFTILEKINVKNVIISKQGEKSENFEKFLKIVNSKKVNVIMAKAEDRILIDKHCYFDIISPSSNLISNNALNNNSIVSKFCYKNEFTMLLTGDIEEIAEKQIVEKYKGTNILNSTILKVAHHGSKTSSPLEFLEQVKPKIALIGVGKKNNFGHPSKTTIEKLEKLRHKNI